MLQPEDVNFKLIMPCKKPFIALLTLILTVAFFSPVFAKNKSKTEAPPIKEENLMPDSRQSEPAKVVRPPIGETVRINGIIKEPCPAEKEISQCVMTTPVYHLKNEGLDGVIDNCGTVYQRQDGSFIICLETWSFQQFVKENVADKEVVLTGRYTYFVDQGRPMSESSVVFLADSIELVK